MTQPFVSFPRSLRVSSPYSNASTASAPSTAVQLKQTIDTYRTRIESGKRRADAAEQRTAELEALNAQKARQVEALEERVRLTRQAVFLMKQLGPVLQRTRDADVKLKRREAGAEEAETKVAALNARMDELEAKYQETLKKKRELDELLSELAI